MAIQKVTMKRFNGTTWDPIYLANSADVTYLGSGFTVTPTKGAFTKDQELTGTMDAYTLLQTIINNLAHIESVAIPALADGSGVTNVPVDSLDGVVDRENLPADIGGKGVEVANDAAKDALTADDVNIGDIVKVTDGKVYLVTDVDEKTGEITYLELTDAASDIAWARITDVPTTLTGYGITDAVAANEKVTEATAANAGKILVLNADGKLDVDITGNAETLGGHEPAFYAIKTDLDATNTRVATNTEAIETLETGLKQIDATQITSGVIDLARLPAAAVETLYITENATTLAALTTEQVQNGDTVKVAATGIMYFVADETKLGTEDYMKGLVEYTAATAAAVDWSGVQNKPTTLQGYGITDAVSSDEKVATGGVANAGKILTLNADGKLEADLAGDAATLGGHSAEYYASAETVKSIQEAIGGADGGIGESVKDLTDTVGDEESGLVHDVATLQGDMTTAKENIENLQSGDGIEALAASKITGIIDRSHLPVDISGALHKVADLDTAIATLTSATAHQGDLVKLNDGRVYVIVDDTKLDTAEGYSVIVDMANGKLSWANITDTPTTAEGYGLTDVITTAMTATEGGETAAGKVAKANDEGKLDFDTTGSAAKLDGHTADYFAQASTVETLTEKIGDEESGIAKDVAVLQDSLKAIDAAWITSGTISIDRLPHGALERCVVVATDVARLALTTEHVQTGDTVKVTGTGMMYFVVDDTKLDSDAGYEIYTAGTASAVDWSGVQNKPTTLAGYGITDAVAANEKVTAASAANAGKILVLNDEGKLDVDITGHADWDNIENGPESTAAEIDAAVKAATHTNRAVLDLLTEVDGKLNYNGKAVAMQNDLDTVALGALKVVTAGDLPEDAASGQLLLEAVSA